MTESNRRRFLRNTSIAVGATAIGVPGVAIARKRYPTVENPYADVSVSELSIEAAKQPHHDRVAFTSYVFGDGFELYMATGASSATDVPDKVLRLTDDTNFGVFDFVWKKGNRLQYRQDGTTYRLKIPLSNKVFTPEKIGKVGYAGLSDEASEWAPAWWKKHLAESRGPGKNVELVSEGVTDWTSADEESPEWFTINEEDELRHLPHGVFRITDAETPGIRTADAEGAELCIPFQAEIGPVKVGFEACHYGGCEWEVSACAAVCIATGMTDSCDGYYSLSGDIGVVNAELALYPEGEALYPSTVVVLTGMKITGEICYYYVADTDCRTMSVEIDYLDNEATQ